MNDHYLHDPQAILDYGKDWTDWLTGAETVTAVTATATGLTISTPAAVSGAGKITTVWLTGGTIGTVYPVTFHITTSAGRQDDRTIWLTAINR